MSSAVRPAPGRSHAPAAEERAVRLLPLLPASGAAVALVIAWHMWPRLPATMVTHWGAGGADAPDTVMPKAWVVGSFLVVCVGGAAWAMVQVMLRRSPHAVGDAALIGGLFSWVGAMGLVSSIWFAERAGWAAFVTLVVPIVLTALVTWGANRAMHDDR